MTPPFVVHRSNESPAIDWKAGDHGKILQGDCHLAAREVEAVCLGPPTVREGGEGNVVELRWGTFKLEDEG